MNPVYGPMYYMTHPAYVQQQLQQYVPGPIEEFINPAPPTVKSYRQEQEPDPTVMQVYRNVTNPAGAILGGVINTAVGAVPYFSSFDKM